VAADPAEGVDLAHQCRLEAQARYASEGDPWSAVMQSDAALTEALLNSSLGLDGDAGQAAIDKLSASYAATLANLTLRPSQLDSVVTQMELLSRFGDALWLGGGDASLYRAASRLLELRDRIRPGARPRGDRPPPAAGSAAKPMPAAAKPRKNSTPAKAAVKRARRPKR
jgi:hypothetical protein